MSRLFNPNIVTFLLGILPQFDGSPGVQALLLSLLSIVSGTTVNLVKTTVGARARDCLLARRMLCQGFRQTFGALIPEDARGAAEVEQWVSLVNTAIDPCLIRAYFLGHIIPKGADGQPDRAAIVGALPAMQKQIDVLDKTVARTGYLAGASFTLADINLLPVLYYVQRFPEGGEMVQSAKSLSAYFARHSERQSYKASFPPPLPGVRTVRASEVTQ
jgi:hypothetical protein